MTAITFTTEIGNVKSEINSGLAAAQYTAKDLVYVSKAIESLAAAATQAGNFETAFVNGVLYVGPAAGTFETTAALTNPVAVLQVAADDFAQIAFKNTSSNASASTDFIAYSNNGDDNAGYIDMGITSSNFADPNFTITGKGDGYIFMTGATGGLDQGNLVLATGNTGSQNKIIFAAGGLASNNQQMVITPDQNVKITIATPSTSPTTGALQVVGGVGISGDVNINGAITFGGASTSLTTSNLAVNDPMIYTGSSNTGDAQDQGYVAKYVTGGNTRYAGLVRASSDGVFKFFAGATTKPTSTVNFSESGLTYASIRVGGATIGSVTNTEIGYLSGVTSAIQTQLAAKAVYPTQTSNSGKYLTTDGTTTSWATVDALPSQSGQSGNYLTTNGTSASWAAIVTDPNPQIFMMMGA
jgi:hypothetical protein